MRIAQTFGQNAVDWENRVDLGRLRTERLARRNWTGPNSVRC
jgi:hypothetical protein